MILRPRCVPEPSNKEGRSVVEGSGLFYSSRLAPVMSGLVFEVFRMGWRYKKDNISWEKTRLERAVRGDRRQDDKTTKKRRTTIA